MSNEEYVELLDDFYDTNQILEVCQGYTQSNTPQMEILSGVLFELSRRYSDLYLSLACNTDYKAVEK